jgi:hypothetical protein
MKKFKEFRASYPCGELQPILDVPTRWNSTFYMIDRALELRQPLVAMMDFDHDLQQFKLDGTDWDYLKRMHTLMDVS